MSRYLEEAAAVLRKAAENVPEYKYAECTRIADGFATLAAIDKGLLPADITADVLRAVTDHYATKGA